MECVLGQRLGTQSSYSECFKYGGGGGGIIRNALDFAKTDAFKEHGVAFGEDR